MTLVWIILVPIIGGLAAWWAGRWSEAWPRWVSLAALAVQLVLAAGVWAQAPDALTMAGQGAWLAQLRVPWIPRFGISLHLGIDGLSLLLVLLTAFLGLVAVACSWTEIRYRVGFFHFNLLWTLAGIAGVFVALDLFLFFFFWELMLIPMYFLIAIWGHERRVYSALKFFIFTQGSGLLMLVAILGLVFVHREATGAYSFDYFDLIGTSMPSELSFWLMLGFFVAFAVKLPAVPVHTWLPDAHTDAPTAGSVVLAGLLLKTGAYGLLRFAGPLFPEAAMDFAPIAMGLGVIGILYGAVLAFAQTDFKRLVAYTSISHLGFVLLGIFAWNHLALQGAVVQMLAHGVSTGALFVIAGMMQERLGTRDMRLMGGLWKGIPKLAAVTLFFALASLGLPGLGNFIGEFLALVGAYRVNVTLTAIAVVGLVAATIYALILVQRSFHGDAGERWTGHDLTRRDMAMMAAMIAVIVWLGVYPQSVLDTAAAPLINLREALHAPVNLAWGPS